jgi:hypothetical protein
MRENERVSHGFTRGAQSTYMQQKLKDHEDTEFTEFGEGSYKSIDDELLPKK